MTPDERKRGLRAAVDAKVKDWMRNRDPQFTLLHASEIERAVFAARSGIDHMWAIIDSLVEECAEYADAVRPADIDEQDTVAKRSYRTMLNLIGHDVGLANPQDMNPVSLTRAIRQIVHRPEARPADYVGTQQPWHGLKRCLICGKAKGQPPERCPGHYDKEPANG